MEFGELARRNWKNLLQKSVVSIGDIVISLIVCLSVPLCIVAKRYILTQKCLKQVNRKCPLRNTSLQLLAPLC